MESEQLIWEKLVKNIYIADQSITSLNLNIITQQSRFEMNPHKARITDTEINNSIGEINSPSRTRLHLRVPNPLFENSISFNNRKLVIEEQYGKKEYYLNPIVLQDFEFLYSIHAYFRWEEVGIFRRIKKVTRDFLKKLISI